MYNNDDECIGFEDELEEEDTVQLDMIPFKKLYEQDMKTGKGFMITEIDGLNNKNERMENGIYSPKYGTMWGDDDAFAEKYRCKCGSLKGSTNKNIRCEKCGEKVKFRDNELDITGWLVLDQYHLINTSLYYMIESLIGGKNVLENIITSTKKSDIKGKMVRDESEKTNAISKYFGIGLIDFHKNFDEIIEYYYKLNVKKRPKIQETYDFIREHRDCVFTQHVPVMSLLLRPIVIGNGNFGFTSLNTLYARIANKIISLNDTSLSIYQKEDRVLKNLALTQKLLINIRENMIDDLHKKEGHVRNNILGARFNYSSRCVISPLSGYRIDQVVLPYITFLELYRPEIINLMVKMENITFNEAHDKWNKACISFDKKIYQIMKYLIKHTKGGLRVLINRNPTELNTVGYTVMYRNNPFLIAGKSC